MTRSIITLSIGVPIEELRQRMADRFDGRWAEVDASCINRSWPAEVGRLWFESSSYASWMGLHFMQGEEPRWVAHADVVRRRGLHQVHIRAVLVNLQCAGWGSGRERGYRTCHLCGDKQAVEDRLHMLCECPAYEFIRDRYESDPRFKGRGMRTSWFNHDGGTPDWPLLHSWTRYGA